MKARPAPRARPMSAADLAADEVRRFYDDLAPDYHLVYADWKASVGRQAAALDRLIRDQLGSRPLTVLDCACGIGTQTIGLSLHGHRVHGTDLSPQAIDRARREAVGFGVGASFAVADMRALDTQVAGTFDVVLACDNAIPHLLADEDLARALRSMGTKLVDGGLLLASLRDYDRLRVERPRVTPPAVSEDAAGRRIVFQLWDWAADADRYTLHLFIVQERPDGWQMRSRTAVYRAIRRDELSERLRQAGFSEVSWTMPEESGYFQPLVSARQR
jgi:glycine/sarcosine N-methyltransferase